MPHRGASKNVVLASCAVTLVPEAILVLQLSSVFVPVLLRPLQQRLDEVCSLHLHLEAHFVVVIAGCRLASLGLYIYCLSNCRLSRYFPEDLPPSLSACPPRRQSGHRLPGLSGRLMHSGSSRHQRMIYALSTSHDGHLQHYFDADVHAWYAATDLQCPGKQRLRRAMRVCASMFPRARHNGQLYGWHGAVAAPQSGCTCIG